MKEMKKQGFTLVEIMIVVAIIGLLAAIGIPSILNAYSSSQERAKSRNIADVEKAKGMLQLPSSVYSGGLSKTATDTPSQAEILTVMQGVDDWADLDVGGTSMKEGDYATPASY
jgi:prepilin-type N-terminal cleavage/methylation domain-containing protein